MNLNYNIIGTQELCESRDGRTSLYGLCGRKTTLNLNCNIIGTQKLCESRGGRAGFPVPISPSGLYGRRATFDLKVESCGFGALRVQELCESRGGRLGPSLIVLTVSVDVKQH